MPLDDADIERISGKLRSDLKAEYEAFKSGGPQPEPGPNPQPEPKPEPQPKPKPEPSDNPPKQHWFFG